MIDRTFSDLVRERKSLPAVSIVGVGGLPITRNSHGMHCLYGSPIANETLAHLLIESIGMGAALTYNNPKEKSLHELGTMCQDYGHMWTAHAVLLTLAFNDAPIAVRNAFAFDGRFHLSWVEKEVNPDLTTFTASGSIKMWKKIIDRVDDKSFKAVQREWFSKVRDLLENILP